MKNVLRAGHAFCVEVEPLALSRVGNQMQAGICVFGEELARRDTHSDASRLSPTSSRISRLVVGVTAQRSVGQQQGHAADGRQVVEHVPQPGELALPWGACRRSAAGHFSNGVPPFLHVEGVAAMTWSARDPGCRSLSRCRRGRRRS